MRLKQLKLSGFKSFVDPTVVRFPGQLLAVVGPNGCGKSNIIDAVRWVLGESSAKNLRGDSMTDVIFNGSSQRKPVGQAFVELVFENNLGRLTGALSSYAEIAIKRVVTRDGDSSYFLNGSRCRRRDITDIFLGTGANARGYSIIGQGTISRLIEAKPEEMRVFLEEAAGVSKYKERRKETLQRIRHTRDNLDRVSDIRDELAKQLQRLERQAKAAERYTELKKDEALCRAEITALKWRDLNHEQTQKQQEITKLAVALEKQQAELTHLEKNKTLLNEQAHEATEQFQAVQTDYYQMATEIARLEESIQQQQREKKRLEDDCLQIEQDIAQAQSQFEKDQQELQSAHEHLEQLKQKKKVLQNDFSEQEKNYTQARLKQEQWQSMWQELLTHVNENQHQAQNLRLKLEHIEQRRGDNFSRIEKLQIELQSVNRDELEKSRQEAEQQQIQLKAQQQDNVLQLKDIESQQQQSREQLQELERLINQKHDNYQQAKAECSALQAAQKAALGQQQHELAEKWRQYPRLLDCLDVDSEWLFACEMVLQDLLQAVVVDSIEDFSQTAEALADFKGTMLTLNQPSTSLGDLKRLSDIIQGPLPASIPDLESIYIAENLTEGLAIRARLTAQESVISKDGYWLGQTWLRVASEIDEDQSGHLARKQKISQLETLSATVENEITTLRQQRDDLNLLLQEQNQAMDEFRRQVSVSNEALRDCEAQLAACQLRLEQNRERTQLIEQEIEEASQILEELAEEKSEFEEQQIICIKKGQDLEAEQAQLNAGKEEGQSLQLMLQRYETVRENLRSAELELERETIKIQQYSDRNERAKQAIEQLNQRQKSMQQRLLEHESPGSKLNETLPAKLEQHHQLEARVNLGREQVASIRTQLDGLESDLKQKEGLLKKTQETMGQIKLEEQALAVKAESLLELLNESAFDLQTLLDKVSADACQQEQEKKLLAIIERIKRLGAINLAAIEEYACESERKHYLDEQCNDLNEALGSLEQAIEKMDKETRSRLKTTFDEVNTSFKSLFPRLFGGGRAQLELTCDNLLEAGIVVMAQPPGKRNSTIHLLSGGEKAMTAVALVFAIFRLNPSPFCMLDEVDAPLDDVNVGRFCDLVKEMSEYIQFLFITHNKITMELADQLMGVTMREPGVSRLVAVDVQQALSME